MSLLGCPGVLPEWPLLQSYEIAYAKMVPVLLNAVAEMGPGAASKAVGINRQSMIMIGAMQAYSLGGCARPCPRSGWYRPSHR